MKKTSPADQFRSDIQMALNRYYAEEDDQGEYAVPVPPVCNSGNCHELLRQEHTNLATALIIGYLNLPGGGDGKSFDLYGLLNAYLRFPDVRAEMNKAFVGTYLGVKTS